MSRTVLAFTVAAAALCPATAAGQPACSPVTANGACRLSIDREQPVTPLPIHVKGGAPVTVVVSRRPFERVVTQETVVETAAPDEFAAILSALLPALQKGLVEPRASSTGGAAAVAGGSTGATDLGQVGEAGRPLAQKLATIRTAQRRVALAISAAEERTGALGAALASLQRTRAGEWRVEELRQFRADFLCAVVRPDPGEPRRCDAGALPEPGRLPAGEMSVLEADLADARRMFGRLDDADRSALRGEFDDASEVQEWLSSRARSLTASQSALASAAAVLGAIDESAMSTDVTLEFERPAGVISATSTIKLVAQDLVSKAVTPLATVVIGWQDSRWELSTGALFSTIPESTFQVSPVSDGGTRNPDTVGGKTGVITESQSKPTVVPMVFAHYRIAERAVSGGTRRLALLASGGIGVNPYSGSADFAAGMTVSYRGFVASLVAHAARPLRLTDEWHTGQVVIGPAPALTTERYWAPGFAVGLSYRIPIK